VGDEVDIPSDNLMDLSVLLLFTVLSENEGSNKSVTCCSSTQ
jgi:hypothetical protein